jgi:hypothetical protein
MFTKTGLRDAMTNLNISLPEHSKDYIKQRVMQSGYGSVDKYFLPSLNTNNDPRAKYS